MRLMEEKRDTVGTQKRKSLGGNLLAVVAAHSKKGGYSCLKEAERQGSQGGKRVFNETRASLQGKIVKRGGEELLGERRGGAGTEIDRKRSEREGPQEAQVVPPVFFSTGENRRERPDDIPRPVGRKTKLGKKRSDVESGKTQALFSNQNKVRTRARQGGKTGKESGKSKTQKTTQFGGGRDLTDFRGRFSSFEKILGGML